MFYMPIFPLGGLYASTGLVLRYWVDKHAVLRRWARQPNMGSVMVDNSNMQMIVCLLSVILTSQRYFATWPFDNQCPAFEEEHINMTARSGYIATSSAWSTSERQRIPGAYVVCDRWQKWLVFQPQEYMTWDQKAAVGGWAPSVVSADSVLDPYIV
jgi:hypothetical protein